MVGVVCVLLLAVIVDTITTKKTPDGFMDDTRTKALIQK
jgi:hypothetical protein